MNLAIEQNWHGKMVRKQARKAAESLIPNRVSNYTSTTFFSRSPHSPSENSERSAVICGLAGKFRTGEKS